MKDWDLLVTDIKEMKSDIKILVKDSATNTADLRTHIARTAAAEQRIDRVENWAIGLVTSAFLAALYYFLHR